MVEETRKHGFLVDIVESLSVSKRDPLSAIRCVVAVGTLLRRYGIDVIHGHNAAATMCAYLGARLNGLKVSCVTSVRGVEERESHRYRNIIWRLLPGILLAVCENGQQRLFGYGVDPQRVKVTYNGVDLSRFEPTKWDQWSVRREFGLSDEVVVGTVGVMVGDESWSGPSKGQHILVQALAKLKDSFPSLRVLFVGDGPMRDRVETLAKELRVSHRVLFAGQRFDIPRLLSAVDIYCLPSIKGEFFPNSILEAMAMGKPWVGSNIAGLSELTANDLAGWVVPIGDVDALADAIAKLASDSCLRQQRGRIARLEVEQKFSIEKVVDRILAAYGAAKV